MRQGGRAVLGVGGNIGSGKTVVSRFFEEFGAFYLSADEIGWQVLSEIADQLKGRFGEVIMDGEDVDRKMLQSIVFSCEENLTFLNKLSHPLLKGKILKRINQITSGMIVIDAALLFDWPEILKEIDYSILICSSSENKKERAVKNGMGTHVFSQILRSQQSETEMAKQATYIINNNGTVQELKEQCHRIFEEIKNDC